MSSHRSDSDTASSSFDLLDERIKRWIWSAGWTSLRDAQEQVIPCILAADRDVIVAAATASGKTEAAFLPILSRLIQPEEEGGSVIYVSPLIALINDQWTRMESLCQDLDVQTVAWHGDITASQKQKFVKNPSGILLITPESLEAMFMRRGSMLSQIFGRTRYVVIDELHSFIGSDRGKQLQSLLHRIETVKGESIPRIALSATLGDMKLAAEFLRPGGAERVTTLVSSASGQELKLQVKGYEDRPPIVVEHGGEDTQVDVAPSVFTLIADGLYESLRGSNNLVFPNSRKQVEVLSDLLRRKCESNGVPNEFWPHHGSLSKELREETEHALKSGEHPSTAICTTTLELGIDIGSVKSIAQVGTPPSVASLRQRLGRSGRRPGDPAVLRVYCVEQVLNEKSDMSDRLREGLIQTVATARLLLSGWCEPPLSGALNLSTFVQQILSVTYERGAVSAAELYILLVKTGPFRGITVEEFSQLLKAMGTKTLLTQEHSGELLLGELGETLTSHYDFYAAFQSDEEWQILRDGHVLGTLPIKSAVWEGQRIIFGGRRWKITSIDTAGKAISVVSDPGGVPPKFDSGRPFVHDGVRAEMRRLLAESSPVTFVDATALSLLSQARTFYRDANLQKETIHGAGDSYVLLTWKGDLINEALALMLRALGAIKISNSGLCIHVDGWPRERIEDALFDISQHDPMSVNELLQGVDNLRKSKWDWILPEALLRMSFSASWLDVRGAIEVAGQMVREKYL